MKKYITPQVECFEFEVTHIIAGSDPNSNEDLNQTQGDFDPGTMVPQARENNNNSNMWNNVW